jgi:phospholipase/carboxylesterase
MHSSPSVNPHLARPLVELGARLDDAHAVVVLVHGRGQTPAYVREHIADRIPRTDVAWWLPHAAGDSWYPQGFLAPLDDNEPSLSHALDAVDALVGALADRGIDHRRLVLAGFSQGGCVVAEYAVRQPSRYGAVVACTGGLIGPPGRTWDELGDFDGTPMLLTTAEDDPYVPAWRVDESAAVMDRMGAAVRHRIFPGADHAVRPEEIADIAALLATVATAV